MKYLIGFTLAFTTAFTFAGSASAGTGYVAIGAEGGSYETDDPTGKYTDVALTGRLGFEFWNAVAIEAEGAINLGGSATFSDSDNFGTRDYKEDITNRYGIFLRGKVPLSDQVDLFGRVGIGGRSKKYEFRATRTNNDGTPFNDRIERNDSDVFGALGIGAEYKLTDDNAIRGEFTYYSASEILDDETNNDSVFALSYVRKF